MAGLSTDLFDVDARNDPFFAQYKEAVALLHGADWKLGLEELERLADEGSIMSILIVSDAMRSGWLYQQDLPGAAAWYGVASETGSVRGLFGLGLTHLLMGRFSDAADEFEKAIGRGFPPAYNALAGMYFRGEGLPTDYQRALELWRKGALLGHLPAKRNLIQQRLRGCYGLLGWFIGWRDLLPYAFEVVAVRRNNPDTDRLR